MAGPAVRRWTMAFAFGLVHGFGFSFALRESLQFAGSHLLTSLLSFNVGVELGQLAVLAVMVPALQVLFRFVLSERIGTIMLSALVGTRRGIGRVSGGADCSSLRGRRSIRRRSPP